MNKRTIDTDANMIDGEPVSEKHLYHEIIVGYAITQCTATDGSRFFSTTPLIHDWQPDAYLGDLMDGEEIHGVIPAEPGTFKVTGAGVYGDYVEVGYEHPGAYHPVWVEELIRQREGMIAVHKRHAEQQSSSTEQQ